MWSKHIIIFLCLILTGAIIFVRVYAANYATGTTELNASVAASIAGITPSNAITTGILFSSLQPGSTNNNASANSNCGNLGTCYNFTIDPASNTDADIAHAANDDLLKDGTGPEEILIGNVSTAGNTTNGTGLNLFPNFGVALQKTNYATLSGCTGSFAVNTSEACHIRYWLNVTAGQTPGSYNTTYCFCGLQTGQAASICGSCT